MKAWSSYVVDALFVIAWYFPVAITAGYLRRVVPKRVAEILDTFFGGELQVDKWQSKRSLARHPAALYLPMGESATAESLERCIKEHVSRFQATSRYVVPMLALILISGCGLWLCRVWVHALWFEPPSTTRAFPNTMSEAVVMALAGAYVWGVWETLDRAQQGNLTPEDVATLSFRWVVCVPIGYATSLLAGDSFKAAFAFAASVFPLKELQRLSREFALKKIPSVALADGPKQMLRSSIEGLSDGMAARLEELSIYTALDMAYANPIHVMIKTGVPIRTVLDWMDQALFAVYVSSQRPAFTALGLRCSIDVYEFAEIHNQDKVAPADEAITALSVRLAMPMAATRDFLSRIAEDPQVQHLFDIWYANGPPKRILARPSPLFEAPERGNLGCQACGLASRADRDDFGDRPVP